MQPTTSKQTANTEVSRTIQRETVGRTYQKAWYAVHSRKVGTDGWYGVSRYESQAEAQRAIDKSGSRYESIGGITVDMGEATDLYEYRIVIVKADCEVLHVELKRV